MQVSKPTITKLEEDFIFDAVKSGDIGLGKYIGKFEQSWADYNQMKYGISCDNGTNALYLALLALGIGKGDEVIVPEFTMVATAWAVSYTGAKPIFVDCADDLNINVSLIKNAISKKTKAIIPVHIYGRKCNMEEINRIAIDYKLWVIEDMAEAHGIIPTGDIVCYSFYGNKIISTGSGGMCLTNAKNLAEEMKLLANMYFNPGHTFLHPKTGHNFRMTNLQASIGFAQVMRIDEILNKRKQIGKWYDGYLPQEFLMPERDVVWMYDIDCNDKQEEIRLKLEKHGIETRLFFKPMSEQPMYFWEGYNSLNASKWSRRGLYLPTYFDMEEKDVINICNIIKS